MSSNLRHELRRRRRALADDVRQAAALAVAERVLALPEFAAADSVGAYMADDGELDPAPLIAACWEQRRRVVLPVVTGENLAFAPYGPDTPLVDNGWGIAEPATGERVAAADLGLVLVPLVGFDRRRHRLGRGRGYYDRAFGFSPRPLLVGLAYELQQVPALDTAPHDVRLDVVATESATYR